MAQTQSEMAAGYGWSLAVINSNPELKSLFAQATSSGPGGNWSTDAFVARVRDTNWFKTNSDTARQSQILQKADPATYNARLAQSVATARGVADTIGAPLDAGALKFIGTEAMNYGWNSDQLKQNMAQYVGGGHGYEGAAATNKAQYATIGEAYGVTISPTQMGNFVRQSVTGAVDQAYVQNWAIQQAQSRYPALASRLASGETVKQIADPYIQDYAKILEVNPNQVGVTDKLIQGALAAKDAKGAPTTQSVWQFDQTLRQDPRYMKTQGAQDAAMTMGKQVLNDWGVMA